MKKSILFVMTGVMTLCLAACGSGEQQTAEAETETVTETVTEEVAPEAAAEATTDAATDVSTNDTEADGNVYDVEEEHEPMVDPTQFATFTEIVDSLDKEAGFANVKIDGTDVLLITGYKYDYDGNGMLASTEAEVYYYDENGAIVYAGYATSGGTSYPLTIVGDKLYAGGNHYVKKLGLEDGKLVELEQAYELFDKDGNATYFIYSSGEETQLEDEKTLETFYDDMFGGEVVVFLNAG